MKVNYLKYSDERNKYFCIKTTICPDGVRKEAVFPEGIVHIERMVLTQEELKKYYSDVEVCKAWKSEDGITFEFVKGEMMLDKYKQAVEAEDIVTYEELLKLHYNLICGNQENQCMFEGNEKFSEWFGDFAGYEKTEGLKYSNFDAIASNIIFRNNVPVFIDYEWVMDFVMPKELVVYHCIKDGYIHNLEFESFYPFQKVLELLGITTDEELLERSYQHFFDYVISDKQGRSYAKDKFLCLKKAQLVTTVTKEWEACANYWKEAVEANQRLKEELQNARTEWEKCANQWKRAIEANDSQREELEHAKEEWLKCANEWKMAVEANQNLQAELAQVTEEYQKATHFIEEVESTLTWRVTRKVRGILGKE